MIAILLATYNSEKYLSAQVDSILSQTYTDWHIYVHDDGSTDSTIEIIRGYISRYPDKISFVKDTRTSLRACGSFLCMQDEVRADYYMFCDHDDVWLPDKIELSFARMVSLERQHSGQPIVVHTDMKVVDEQLNIVCESFWKYMRLLPDHCSLAELAVCHCVNGCTIMFNAEANRLALKNKDYALMHDILLSESVAAAGGIISPVEEPTVLYRQHGDNVLGADHVTKKALAGKFMSLKSVWRESSKSWRMANHIHHLPVLKFIFTKIRIEILRVLRYR